MTQSSQTPSTASADKKDTSSVPQKRTRNRAKNPNAKRHHIQQHYVSKTLVFSRDDVDDMTLFFKLQQIHQQRQDTDGVSFSSLIKELLAKSLNTTNGKNSHD